MKFLQKHKNILNLRRCFVFKLYDFPSSHEYVYLNHQHNDEYKDEHGVEVGDVEGGTQSSNQRVPTDDRGQQHGRRLGGQVAHQAEQWTYIYCLLNSEL